MLMMMMNINAVKYIKAITTLETKYNKSKQQKERMMNLCFGTSDDLISHCNHLISKLVSSSLFQKKISELNS